jgi:hypothetical protein
MSLLLKIAAITKPKLAPMENKDAHIKIVMAAPYTRPANSDDISMPTNHGGAEPPLPKNRCGSLAAFLFGRAQTPPPLPPSQSIGQKR